MIKYPRSKFGTTSRPESRCYSPASQFYCVIASRFLPTAFQFAIDFEIFLIARCRSRANEEQVTCRMKRGRLWVQLTARAAYKTGIPFAGACFSSICPPVVTNRERAELRHWEAFPCAFALSVRCRDKHLKPANDFVRRRKITASCFLAPKTGPSFTHSARTDKVLLP
ncbi:hypothetical protein SAMN05428964_10887 [Thalassospira xiamenensis]|uniref:Uncharacterized protein n=1 Tax=Thalassospira xiamenensis TaxID=220697 RepID=A0A285TX19_9PROT|nr:hypothetical protein SAMN05428964_10887 [Thalassospira xiamenensis]